MKFAFDNSARHVATTRIGDEDYDWFDWTVFMNETPDKLALVRSVEYRLHETFPNPIRTVTNRDSRFALESSGWGEFMIRIAVNLNDGQTVHANYELDLSKAWPGDKTKDRRDPPRKRGAG